MKNKLLILFYLTCLCWTICFNACVQKQTNTLKKDPNIEKRSNSTLVPPSKKENPLQPYSDFLQALQVKRKRHTNAANMDSMKLLLFQFIHQDIPAYWIGTKWNFNGTTQVPREGTIACGYFITNTLTDFGLKIPRFKLAQVPSSEMIETLCVDIQKPATFEDLIRHIEGQKNETVFIVGLDFHTGYITKASNDEIYFIHSNYIRQEGVVKERVQESKALKSSNFYMIGNLSENRRILQ